LFASDCDPRSSLIDREFEHSFIALDSCAERFSEQELCTDTLLWAQVSRAGLKVCHLAVTHRKLRKALTKLTVREYFVGYAKALGYSDGSGEKLRLVME
jgi:hypothetical protein